MDTMQVTREGEMNELGVAVRRWHEISQFWREEAIVVVVVEKEKRGDGWCRILFHSLYRLENSKFSALHALFWIIRDSNVAVWFNFSPALSNVIPWMIFIGISLLRLSTEINFLTTFLFLPRPAFKKLVQHLEEVKRNLYRHKTIIIPKLFLPLRTLGAASIKRIPAPMKRSRVCSFGLLVLEERIF